MSFVITGATGQLGRLVVESLLDRGVRADEIVATGRNLARLGGLADCGVRTRAADYNDTGSLHEVFAGADKVLLVSSSEVGQRITQHRNVIDAAAAAGVGLLVYTSIANADRTAMQLAAEHLATEKLLAESGLPFTLLRNGWYLENYTNQLPTYLEHGAVLGSAGDGRVSAATRADFAEAAAVVLLSDGQAGKIYELGGDTAFSLVELAAAVSDASGRAVAYQDLPPGEYTQALVRAGLSERYATILADSDLGIARGDLHVTTGDLGRLLNRPTTTMSHAVRTATTTADVA